MRKLVLATVVFTVAFPAIVEATTFSAPYELGSSGITEKWGVADATHMVDKANGKIGGFAHTGGVGSTSTDSLIGGTFRVNSGPTLSSIHGNIDLDLHVRGTVACVLDNIGGATNAYGEFFLRRQEAGVVKDRVSFKKYGCNTDPNEDVSQGFGLTFKAGTTYEILTELVVHSDSAAFASSAANFNGNGREVVVRSIEIANLPPRARATDASTSYTSNLASGVLIPGVACDYDRYVDRYRWEFGDGAVMASSSSGPCVTADVRHTYAVPGVFIAKLCAWDNDDVAHCEDATVSVTPL